VRGWSGGNGGEGLSKSTRRKTRRGPWLCAVLFVSIFWVDDGRNGDIVARRLASTGTRVAVVGGSQVGLLSSARASSAL
jgi:hypothetical protein